MQGNRNKLQRKRGQRKLLWLGIKAPWEHLQLRGSKRKKTKTQEKRGGYSWGKTSGGPWGRLANAPRAELVLERQATAGFPKRGAPGSEGEARWRGWCDGFHLLGELRSCHLLRAGRRGLSFFLSLQNFQKNVTKKWRPPKIPASWIWTREKLITVAASPHFFLSFFPFF